MNNQPFGQHLTIDGYGGDAVRLQDLRRIWQLLDDLPDLLGMTKITQPYVFPYAGLVPEDWGVTGFVVIAESHISLHTFADLRRRFLALDVFSCKPFDAAKVLQVVQEEFDLAEVETNNFPRGTWYGRQKPVHVPAQALGGGG